MAKKSSRKIFLIVTSAFLGLFVIAALIASPLAKHLMEKYDQYLFGREITIGRAYVNIFTGYVSFQQVKISEEKSDSVFLSSPNVHGNISRLRLFWREVKISQLTFEKPRVNFIQNKRKFNIDDLIARFTPSKSPSSSSAWNVEFIGVKIAEGELHFIDKIIPIKYFIKKATIEAFGRLDAGDTVATRFDFLAGIGTGHAKGNFTFNTESLDYHYDVVVRDYDLDIIRQYIWELINYGMFTAHLNANVNVRGNFNSQETMSGYGRVALNDFHLGKTTTNDYAAFKKLEVVVEELDPANKKYLFDSIVLTRPFFKYEIYDSLDNVARLFGTRGSNISDITRQSGRFNLVIEIVKYVKVLSNNFFRSDFKIKRLEVKDGNFEFNDYSLSDKFSISVLPFSLLADSVNKKDRRVQVFIQSSIQPYGKGSIQLGINPKDSTDFDMVYRFEKIPASIFNPYLLTYTSFPLDRGTIELNGRWNVKDGMIRSSNHLLIIDPRVSKRTKNKDLKWLPMPLIMALVREQGNVIDYEIPITGNLKNPKFHWGDAIFDLLKNIFVKPPRTPYRLEVRNLENKIEENLSLKWEMRQSNLQKGQIKFLKKISTFLKDNTSATMAVHPVTYSEKEKEHILFFETKKKYFMLTRNQASKSLSPKDSIEVERMSVKDPSLVRLLSKNISDTVMFTIQEKCMKFLGNKIVDDRFDQLIKERNNVFVSHFRRNGTDKQIKIHENVNHIPYNGFSHFNLIYEKGVPESLRDAQQHMIELNNRGVRKKYKKYRKDAPLSN